MIRRPVHVLTVRQRPLRPLTCPQWSHKRPNHHHAIVVMSVFSSTRLSTTGDHHRHPLSLSNSLCSLHVVTLWNGSTSCNRTTTRNLCDRTMTSPWRVSSSALPFGFLLVCVVVSQQLARAATTATGFASTLSRGNVEYVSLKVSEDSEERLWENWQEKFASQSHAIHSYDSHENPKEALSVIDESFCFVMQFLPPALVSRLHQFAFDPQAPCAIVIRGLPLFNRQAIPPTPVMENIYATSRHARCPVAETILLGLSRLCGMLHAPPKPLHAQIVRDICPTTSGALGFLPMHRDYAHQVLPNLWEPELLLLMCVRTGSSPECVAETVVMDSHRLWQCTCADDRQLLRTYRIQKKTRNHEGDLVNMGEPFYAIQDKQDGTFDLQTCCVTLFNSFTTSHVCDDAQGDLELEQRVLAAYERLSRNAEKAGERISLGPGDLLIINNARCVHGRTAHQPRLDGTDRWLIKTYVSNGLWRKPSCTNQINTETSTVFPALDFSTSAN